MIPGLLQSLPSQRGNTAFPKLTSYSPFHLEPPALPSSNLNTQILSSTSICNTQKPSQSRLLPVLSYLESLNIAHGSSYRNRQELVSREGLDAARAYVQHSRSTLTIFGLTHCSFTLHDLGMLLGILGRGSSETVEGVCTSDSPSETLSPLNTLAPRVHVVLSRPILHWHGHIPQNKQTVVLPY